MLTAVTRCFYKATPSKQRSVSKAVHQAFAVDMSNKVEEIIEFWFGEGHCKWFGGGLQTDNLIREKYGDVIEMAFQGKLDDWKSEPKASLALILICDQFCRNVHRGSKKMFGLDHVALELAKKFVERKTHNHLEFPFFQRVFMYMPFEHDENRTSQELSVQYTAQLSLIAKTDDEKNAAVNFLKYAKLHKEVIDKFGRFPQRNMLLQRESTPEEAEFLANLPSKYKW